ncbi:MAG: cobalamin-binding protein [Firmicutes bacterium]|nr:cobalamin-binding protein [Bacillota bacterium]
MADLIKEIHDMVVEYKKDAIAEKVDKAINEGKDAESILNDGLIAAMDVVGEKYSTGEVFIPEMLASAKTMKIALEKIKPHLQKDVVASNKGVVVIGTVKDDIHDIGKNLVAMMLEGAGFEVHDIGIDNSPENFISKAKEVNAQILGLSALLTTTMPMMKETVEALKDEGLYEKIHVIVGGAPVSQQYADEIGARGYAADAVVAVEKIKNLMDY